MKILETLRPLMDRTEIWSRIRNNIERDIDPVFTVYDVSRLSHHQFRQLLYSKRAIDLVELEETIKSVKKIGNKEYIYTPDFFEDNALGEDMDMYDTQQNLRVNYDEILKAVEACKSFSMEGMDRFFGKYHNRVSEIIVEINNKKGLNLTIEDEFYKFQQRLVEVSVSDLLSSGEDPERVMTRMLIKQLEEVAFPV